MRQLFPLMLLMFLVGGAYCQDQAVDDDDFDVFDGDTYQPVMKKPDETIPPKEQPVADSPDVQSDPQANHKIEILELETPLSLSGDPLRGYHWETFLILLCVFYIVFYVYGRLQNETISDQWLNHCLPILNEEFAAVGEDSKDVRMVRQNDALYRIWLSGRKNMNGLLVELHLSRRFCALQTAVALGRGQDTCSFTIDFGPDELDTFVLLICFDSRISKKSIMTRLTDYTDLAQFCHESKNTRKNCRVFTELGEPVEMILSDGRIQSLLSRGLMRMLHISDQYQRQQPESGTPQKPTRTIYAEFNLTRGEQDQVDCLKFVLYLADKLSQFKLSREAKQRAIKNRQLAEEQARKNESKQRQEIAKQRREEKLREEKRRVENDPELLRRLEEKQHKKEVRRKQQKAKQMMVKAF